MPCRPAERLNYREDEFCAWTYTRGFWENGKGELMQVNGGKRHIARSIFSV